MPKLTVINEIRQATNDMFVREGREATEAHIPYTEMKRLRKEVETKLPACWYGKSKIGLINGLRIVEEPDKSNNGYVWVS